MQFVATGKNLRAITGKALGVRCQDRIHPIFQLRDSPSCTFSAATSIVAKIRELVKVNGTKNGTGFTGGPVQGYDFFEDVGA
jgi:hypothetical protein